MELKSTTALTAIATFVATTPESWSGNLRKLSNAANPKQRPKNGKTTNEVNMNASKPIIENTMQATEALDIVLYSM